jgi:hypothetical protein
VREWRDIHTQLHTVVAEHGWRLNGSAATYEQVHLSMLAGLLGNIGLKGDEDDWYLGARGIKFWRHPGAHLSKKPGRWIVAAELVDTTRLFGRGIANIEPQWIPQMAGHLLKVQLMEPHWEKKAAEVIALERATLVRHRHLQQPAREFRQCRPGGGARHLHPRGAGQRRVGNAPALRRAQPEADPPGRGAGTQVAPPGRAGRRRADLCLLRAAPAGRRVFGRQPGALVPPGLARRAQTAAPEPRRADAPRGCGHHHGQLSRRPCAWAASIAPPLICTNLAMRATASR